MHFVYIADFLSFAIILGDEAGLDDIASCIYVFLWFVESLLILIDS